jgi:hypothetical protein
MVPSLVGSQKQQAEVLPQPSVPQLEDDTTDQRKEFAILRCRRSVGDEKILLEVEVGQDPQKRLAQSDERHDVGVPHRAR